METIDTFTNPFADESSDLFNLVTKVVMPHNIKEDFYICRVWPEYINRFSFEQANLTSLVSMLGQSRVPNY